jgi:hypothetical protein
VFCVWKKKFQSLGTKTLLHKWKVIFYIMTSTIVMHNMMVEKRVQNCEGEGSNYYEVADVEKHITRHDKFLSSASVTPLLSSQAMLHV